MGISIVELLELCQYLFLAPDFFAQIVENRRGRLSKPFFSYRSTVGLFRLFRPTTYLLPFGCFWHAWQAHPSSG
jgi:hypothetical protein